MNNLFSTIFFMLICINSEAQNKKNAELPYSFAPVQINLMDTNLTKVSASINVQSLKTLCTSSTIFLNSKSHQYSAHANDEHQFNFGFIEPGKYELSLITNEKSKKNYKLKNTDSIVLDAGGIYELKAIKGKYNPDSCCMVGYSFVIPIYFDLDKWNLDSTDKIVLNSIYKTIQKYNLKVEIGVHFDERLSKYLSTCLSCRRADVIREYMISLGLNPEQIKAKGYEATDPYFLNAKTEEQHQLNRRINVKIIE